MENNKIINSNKINYLNNGRISQNFPIYSTKIKKTQYVNNSTDNGKIFSKNFTEVIQQKKIKDSNNNKQEKNSVLSWVLNTINPLNHIPIVSTLHKLSNHTNKSLDIVQSAIGGAIYGGGPVGSAKGIGNWLINKIIPKNLIAIKKKPANSDVQNTNEKFEKTSTEEISKKIDTENIKPYNSNQNRKKSINTMNSLSNLKSSSYKTINSNYLYYYSKEEKKTKNKIDVDA